MSNYFVQETAKGPFRPLRVKPVTTSLTQRSRQSVKCLAQGHNKPNCQFDLYTSDVARPLSYKRKTIYFFKTKTAFLKTIKLLT